jgi:hypothetical protein
VGATRAVGAIAIAAVATNRHAPAAVKVAAPETPVAVRRPVGVAVVVAAVVAATLAAGAHRAAAVVAVPAAAVILVVGAPREEAEVAVAVPLAVAEAVAARRACMIRST